MEVTALDPADERRYTVNVAGPAALLVAKLHKIGERVDGPPDRLVDKDAHDIYRVLIDSETDDLAEAFARLSADPVSEAETAHAMEYLDKLFASGATALGSTMAGRAEAGIGAPETVSLQTSVLASDLLSASRRGRVPRPL